MEPYWKAKGIIVYHGDAREVMPEIETESVDLVITDPPYGRDWLSNRRSEQFERIANDTMNDRDTIHEVLRHCVRAVGQNRHIYVFGPNDVLGGLKVSETVEIIWDKIKMSTGNLRSAWGPAHEPITFAVSKHRHGGQTGESALPARMRKGTVLRAMPPTGRKVRHPTEKPLKLLRELIESSSRQGETVLDPFAGVGSTGVAALLLGRSAVLIDTDTNYLDIAVERLQNAARIAEEARRA